MSGNLPANIVDGLVVDHEGAVGMFQSGVGGQYRVVRLNDGSRHLRRWIDGKLKFGLLSIINGQPDTWWGGRKAEESKGKSGGRDRRREGKEGGGKEGGEKGGKGKRG